MGDDFLKVNDESISQKDFQKEGYGTIRVIKSSGPGMLEYPMSMGVDYYEFLTDRLSQRSVVNFVANRLLLKQEAADLGIYPSSEAAEKYIQENLFKNADGAFDESNYNSFIESIGSVGFDEKDYKALVAEFLVFEKTRDVIGGGLVAPREGTLAQYKSQTQKVDLLTVVFEADTFKEAIKPTDEQLQKYWSERKEKYLTDRQLKISYVLAQVPTDDKPVMPEITPETDPQVATKMNLDHQQAVEQYNANRKSIVDSMTKRYVNFIEYSQDTDYKEFEKPAEESGFTVVKTDFFSASNIPAELNGLMTVSSGNIGQALFNYKFGEGHAYKTVPFELRPDGYIAVRLDEEKLPEPKTFEAAKEQATKDYIADEARKAMEKAAADAQTALAEMVKSGKSFEEAAKEKGLTVVPVGPFGAGEQPAGAKSAQELFRVASITTPGEIAKDLATTKAGEQPNAADTATVVFVKDRTIEKTPNAAALEAEQLSSLSNQLKYIAFQAWFGNLRKEADMKLPATE